MCVLGRYRLARLMSTRGARGKPPNVWADSAGMAGTRHLAASAIDPPGGYVSRTRLRPGHLPGPRLIGGRDGPSAAPLGPIHARRARATSPGAVGSGSDAAYQPPAAICPGLGAATRATTGARYRSPATRRPSEHSAWDASGGPREGPTRAVPVAGRQLEPGSGAESSRYASARATIASTTSPLASA